MDVKTITPLVITYNEEANIARTLDRLGWANRVVVIDSGSTDETLSILQRYPMVETFWRPFDSFAAQLNFGLTKVDTEWVLALDADYEISEELKQYSNIRFNYFETTVTDGQLQFSYQLKDGVSNDRLGYLILRREGVVDLLQKL